MAATHTVAAILILPPPQPHLALVSPEPWLPQPGLLPQPFCTHPLLDAQVSSDLALRRIRVGRPGADQQRSAPGGGPGERCALLFSRIHCHRGWTALPSRFSNSRSVWPAPATASWWSDRVKTSPLTGKTSPPACNSSACVRCRPRSTVTGWPSPAAHA